MRQVPVSQMLALFKDYESASQAAMIPQLIKGNLAAFETMRQRVQEVILSRTQKMPKIQDQESKYSKSELIDAMKEKVFEEETDIFLLHKETHKIYDLSNGVVSARYEFNKAEKAESEKNSQPTSHQTSSADITSPDTSIIHSSRSVDYHPKPPHQGTSRGPGNYNRSHSAATHPRKDRRRSAHGDLAGKGPATTSTPTAPGPKPKLEAQKPVTVLKESKSEGLLPTPAPEFQQIEEAGQEPVEGQTTGFNQFGNVPMYYDYSYMGYGGYEMPMYHYDQATHFEEFSMPSNEDNETDRSHSTDSVESKTSMKSLKENQRLFDIEEIRKQGSKSSNPIPEEPSTTEEKPTTSTIEGDSGVRMTNLVDKFKNVQTSSIPVFVPLSPTKKKRTPFGVIKV